MPSGAAGQAGVLAPNVGPMTLEGTWTWVLESPTGAVVVVDPGPADDTHLRALLAVLGPRRPRALLLTHGHPDHDGAVPAWQRRFAVPVLRPGLDGPGDLEDLLGPGARVLITPGHTADSACLLLPADPAPGAETVPTALLTGDTVLGRGSTVIAEPDGDLAAYLESLALLAAVVDDAQARGAAVRLLPGHGPVRDDAAAWLRTCRTHRAQRLAQVRDAVASGARTPADVVRLVYPDLVPSATPGADGRLYGAALQSAAAQLRYLDALG